MARVLILVLLCAAGLVAGDPVSTGTITDRMVRSVNDHPITMGDIWIRNQERLELTRRAGKVPPETQAQILAFIKQSLEELTDETLLVQKADELKVKIDSDRLSGEVLAEARARGLQRRDIALLRTVRERQEKINTILEWFESRTTVAGPDEVEAFYRSRLSDFTRPPRARTLLLALRPASAEQKRDAVTFLARLFKLAQGDPTPAIAAAATSRLDAFLAADVSGQEQILAAAATDIAAVPRAGLAKGSAQLADEAVRLLAAWRQLRDRNATLGRLEAIRAELMELPPLLRGAVFRQRASDESQGPHAADAGELGWVEPGTYGREIEEQALAMPPFEPSPVFWTGDAAALVLVLEREPGRVQSLAEVNAALQSWLDRAHREQVRARVTSMLRSQASIRDVISVEEALR